MDKNIKEIQETTQDDIIEAQKAYDEEYDKLWEKYENGETNDIDENIDIDVDENDNSDNDVVDDEIKIGENIDSENDENAKDNNEEDNSVNENEDSDETETKEQNIKDEKKEQKTFKFKAIGTEFELTEPEVIELAKKGLDYTRKTQALSQWRSKIELINDIPDEHLYALKDLKNGNKDAILKLAKDYNVDLMELDIDKEPQIADYSTNPVIEELKSVEEQILQDKETLPEVESVLNAIPDDFKNQMAQNPKLLYGLYVDIKNGIGKKAVAEALKNQALYGGDFLTNYGKAFQELQQKQQSTAPQMSKETVDKAKKAKIPSTRQQSQKRDYLKDAEEIWNMSPEDFAKYKAKIMRNV